MRKLIAISLILFICNNSFAQNKPLLIEGTTPALYLNHIIAAKENYYSIGRMFNVSPRDLASYNNLQFEKGLSLGQVLKIPLSEANFSQGQIATKEQALIPVYHIVQPKEGLYRISMSYNKVSLENLKKWNSLSVPEVANGLKLIVGYLKVEKEQSSLSRKPISNPEGDGKVILNNEVEPSQKRDLPKDRMPVDNNPVKQKEINTSKDDMSNGKDNNQNKNIVSTNIPTRSKIDFDGGYFKKIFPNQRENKPFIQQSGTAGIFKTTSGWLDGKYYCFHNEAIPGTIIKITNNSNGKSVYAKVLDAIPDIKQNSGVLIRLSNSAAEELLVGNDSKFECSITFKK